MAKTPRVYQRLTRPTSSVGSYNSLWLAADHLLILKSNGYTEDYQRLQLRDIKGFFVVGGNRRLYWGLAWGLIALISGIVMVAALTSHETPIGSVIVFVPAAIILAWNTYLGAGCRTFVVTGVQTASLPSLVRLPKARKILQRLHPLIEAAQADLGTRPAPVNLAAEPPPLQ